VEKVSRSVESAQAKGEPVRDGAHSPPAQESLRLGSFSGLQHTLGNRVIRRQFHLLRVQRKTQIHDADALEGEADQAAAHVVERTHSPALQRKCSGGGSCSCAKCREQDEDRRLSRANTRIQLQPREASSAGKESAEAKNRQPRSLILDDEAPSIAPGQMRKSAFLDRLEAEVCATADAELASVGRSAGSCPYIANWLAHYRKQSSAHIERALVKYAPEAATAGSANDYFPMVHRRVRQAVSTWAKTGKITGVPPGVSMMPPSSGGEERSGEGFGAGIGNALSATAKVLFKKRESKSDSSADPETVRSQLGSGRTLDSGARSRMEAAFGHDFSGVRIHTDSRAASLSSNLNARAFTIGSDVAFGSGEYNPSTPAGDALLAHELAHVVQQGGGNGARPAAMAKSANQTAQSSQLEADADLSALAVVSTTWLGATMGLAGIGRNFVPRLRSGLRLSRCSSKGKLLINFEERFPEAGALIRKSPSAMTLVKEADDAGAKFGGFVEQGPEPGKSGGRAFTSCPTVYVPKSRTDPPEAMRDFLFELNNAIRCSRISALQTEAEKGTKGTLTAKDYAYKIAEVEVEGMLRLGQVWFETKKTFGSDKKWDKYDTEFFLAEYQDYKDGKKTKDDIVKEVLHRTYETGDLTGKTVEQHYMEQFQTVSGGK
jgi:hypothetical protein